MSPAENLTETTTHLLTFRLVPGSTAIVFVATLECFIGICLLLKRWMRLAVWLLVAEAIGVLSQLFLVPLSSGPHHAPTLEANTSSRASCSSPRAWSSPRRRSAAAG